MPYLQLHAINLENIIKLQLIAITILITPTHVNIYLVDLLLKKIVSKFQNVLTLVSACFTFFKNSIFSFETVDPDYQTSLEACWSGSTHIFLHTKNQY